MAKPMVVEIPHELGRDEARKRIDEGTARVRDALDDCARQARAQQVRRALWFTHAGVIRAVDVWLTQTAQPLRARDWPAKACEFGHWQIRVLKTSPSGLIIGTRWR